MAKKQKVQKSQYEYEYKTDFVEDWDIHRNYINTFDAYEAMLMGQVYDSVSQSIDGSKITDSYTTTLAIERSARVVGKLPDGMTEASAKGDAGKAALLEVIRQKWIYPNANAQHPFLTKLRLWQLYSTVYGYMPMFYDWNSNNSGYLGPDCWLFNPRNLVPQQGRVSLSDMDYVTAFTWHGRPFFENIMENEEEEDGWNREAVQELLDLAKDATTEQDTDEQTEVERTRTDQSVKKGIKLATRYESGEDGEWVTFAPDYSYVELRRIKNPHKNGRIPFVIKYSQPLFDSFYGLGDFQRAKPLQFARDGLTNFYFRGIKMNLVPPLIINANGVVKHTIDYREGGVMHETVPNSIRRLETSTAGLATYQGAQTNLTGSLLALYGSQNASIPGAESLNPSQGKTPAAINMYQAKEDNRDGQERAFLEGAIEELTDAFYSLVINVGTEDIPVNLFFEDIKSIFDAGKEDVLGMFDGNFKAANDLKSGELTIKQSALKGIEARYHITRGTTAKVSKEEQLNAVERLVGTIAKYQNLLKDDPNVEVNFGQLLKTAEELTDVPGMKDFITIKDGPTKQEMELMQVIEQLQMQMQQLQQQAEQQIQEARMTNITPPTFNVNGQVFENEYIANAAKMLGEENA